MKFGTSVFKSANNIPYQQKLYYDSFLAAFPLTEVNEMLIQMDMPGAIVVQSTDRRWLIERSA